MNGNNCQRHRNVRWVQRANQFITNNRRNPDYRAHVLVVEYLLQRGHCGIDFRVSIDEIIDYLSNRNIHTSRSVFQNTVLIELKREGIVATLVYPGPMGGVFIPCATSEVRTVTRQVNERIRQMRRNIRDL